MSQGWNRLAAEKKKKKKKKKKKGDGLCHEKVWDKFKKELRSVGTYT